MSQCNPLALCIQFTLRCPHPRTSDSDIDVILTALYTAALLINAFIHEYPVLLLIMVLHSYKKKGKSENRIKIGRPAPLFKDTFNPVKS